MKYIRLDNNVAVEIIPEENPELPGFPIDDRYPAKFIAALIPIADTLEILPGDIYDPSTGTFSAPPPIPEPTLAEIAEQKAAQATAAAEIAAQAKAEADAAAEALAAETEPTT